MFFWKCEVLFGGEGCSGEIVYFLVIKKFSLVVPPSQVTVNYQAQKNLIVLKENVYKFLT